MDELCCEREQLPWKWTQGNLLTSVLQAGMHGDFYVLDFILTVGKIYPGKMVLFFIKS